MRRALLACLSETGGKVSGPGGAAELMGIPATTIHSRMPKFAIAPQDWSEDAPRGQPAP